MLKQIDSIATRSRVERPYKSTATGQKNDYATQNNQVGVRTISDKQAKTAIASIAPDEYNPLTEAEALGERAAELVNGGMSHLQTVAGELGIEPDEFQELMAENRDEKTEPVS